MTSFLDDPKSKVSNSSATITFDCAVSMGTSWIICLCFDFVAGFRVAVVLTCVVAVVAACSVGVVSVTRVPVNSSLIWGKDLSLSSGWTSNSAVFSLSVKYCNVFHCVNFGAILYFYPTKLLNCFAWNLKYDFFLNKNASREKIFTDKKWKQPILLCFFQAMGLFPPVIKYNLMCLIYFRFVIQHNISK